MAISSKSDAEKEKQGTPVVDRLVAFLNSPSSYHEQTSSVQCIETHISWVFLTDHFAYKLKKPVKFEFLDFSTQDLRKSACDKEVELNRRLAQNVYLGVKPIVRTLDGDLALDRPGEAVDWVVKMHRLPATKSLDVQLRGGSVNALALESVANKLTQFYCRIPPVALAVAEYHDHFERHVEANRDELLAASHHLKIEQVRRIHASQLRILRFALQLLANRVLDGRIVKGHGDLRPEHIYLTYPPVIIDCIEFNDEFRTLDVADELSFLGMECDALGASNVGGQILQRYIRESEDVPPSALLSFYRTYRACVRAKVFALRADQMESSEQLKTLAKAQLYLDLADQYVKDLGPPVVVVVRGLSGSGKSTVAELISREVEATLLQTDVIRQELLAPIPAASDFNEGRYSWENRAKVYEEMHARAGRLLRDGSSVVLDGTYLTQESRREVATLANHSGAKLLCVECVCPDRVAAERIAVRSLTKTSISEARSDFPGLQRQVDEPNPPGFNSISVDTTSSNFEPTLVLQNELGKAFLPDEKMIRSPTFEQ